MTTVASCGLLLLLGLAPSGAHARGLRDRAELEAFLDGVMAANLRDNHVAGATVSVVKDGALFFTKGYGYADVERRKPVNPERTLFRIGSVSKVFTWTAVMQLAEDGRLDLDADVNRYLDFKIAPTYAAPITLRTLLTHTAGFEDDSRDIFRENGDRPTPPGVWLERHLPGRVRPPGQYPAYSNYGAALAGYVVARVSGMPWEEYVERRILEPLGMSQTTPRQPLPSRLRENMSTGFKYAKAHFDRQPFEMLDGLAPAGAISASATDMAKFMLAHLENGSFGGGGILGESPAGGIDGGALQQDPRRPGGHPGLYGRSRGS